LKKGKEKGMMNEGRRNGKKSQKIGKEERKERDERRRNIIIKRLKEEEGNEKQLEGVWKKLGVGVKVEEVKRVRAGGGGGMVIVKIGSEEEKKGIMQNKWRLKGEEVWIEEDLTWEERKVRWKIRQLAIREEAKEKRVRIGQGGLWIEGKWWGWDEEKGELADMKGGSWEEGKEEQGRREEGGFIEKGE